MKVGIVGGRGGVGEELVGVVDERKLGVDEVVLLGC